MIAILLLTAFGSLVIWLSYQVADDIGGVVLAAAGVLLLWCAFLAAVKRSGKGL